MVKVCRVVPALVACVSVAVTATVAEGQALSSARAEDVGMSTERLRVIGQVLQSEIDQAMIPGSVVAVARRGKLVYHEAFGYLDEAAGTPMPLDAIFSIASDALSLTGSSPTDAIVDASDSSGSSATRCSSVTAAGKRMPVP